MEYVGFDVIKDNEKSLRKWEKNKVRESGIVVSSDDSTIISKSDNLLVIDDVAISRKNNYFDTSLKILCKCEDKPSFIIISEDLRVLDRARKILVGYKQYNIDYVDLGRDDDMGFLMNRVDFTESSVVLIHASDSKFENKKIVLLMDRFINKAFLDNKNKNVRNKVYMYIDCVHNLSKSQLLVKSISFRKPDNLRYVFIVDDLDCFNYDYLKEAKLIKDSCNSILYYHSSDIGTLKELSRIANFERKVINKAIDERVVFDFATVSGDDVVHVQLNGLSRITKIKE